ncbi:MAG TPA: NAD(P)H-dependent oxidoreductase [Gemmatimonadaceae bacterium]|jgi:NAD(P)H-dependent FMN reductase
MSDSPVRIALIIGSTRPNRFADVPVRWLRAAAAPRDDLVIETLDLRDWKLPYYEEPATPLMTGGAYTNAEANRWRAHIATFDGFIATAAEYNHGPTAVLKNALDSAFHEWADKPITFVGYGASGGARAVEQLRMHVIELQMAAIKHAVHINMEPFLGIVREGKSLDDYAYLVQSRDAMFERLAWWARALRAARHEKLAAA